MSNLLDGIPLSDLTEDHLKSLILLKVSENIRIDYKKKIKLSTGREKRELCKDITALANTQGGYLFFGIEESNGIPMNLSGIDFDDNTRQQFYQILTSGVAPRLQSMIDTEIKLQNGKSIFVVKINPDGILHQVKYDDNRFYKRTGTITIHMDSADVETLFRATDPSSRLKEIKESRDRYFSALRNKKYFKGIGGKALCALFITPEVASYKLD
ncbi:unnamed protein product, partial [marine sediment metagenome]